MQASPPRRRQAKDFSLVHVAMWSAATRCVTSAHLRPKNGRSRLPASAERVVELNQSQCLLLFSGLQGELIAVEVAIAGQDFQIAG
jgi:hypothetical protein